MVILYAVFYALAYAQASFLFFSRALLNKSLKSHFRASDTAAKCNVGAIIGVLTPALHLAAVSEARKKLNPFDLFNNALLKCSVCWHVVY